MQPIKGQIIKGMSKVKKYILICLLIFLTGCSAQYNLKITDGNYDEEIIITGSNSDENSALNRKWSIPYEKELYEIGDENSQTDRVYDYKYDNGLVFSHQFTRGTIGSSTAISICYNTVTINDYDDNFVISTSATNNCFDKYPALTSITVNITVDKKVISHNADSVDGHTYTWKITKNDLSKQAINMVLENDYSTYSKASAKKEDNKSNAKDKYTMYIFYAILLVVFLTCYAIYKKITKDDESID